MPHQCGTRKRFLEANPQFCSSSICYRLNILPNNWTMASKSKEGKQQHRFYTADSSKLTGAHALKHFTNWLAAARILWKYHQKCNQKHILYVNCTQTSVYTCDKQLGLHTDVTWLTVIIRHSRLFTQEHASCQTSPIPSLWQSKNLE